MNADWLGAAAVGRFKDGTLIINHGSPQGNVSIPNDFNFGNGTGKEKCPFHAHIRKTNPRGDTTAFVSLEEERSHRIARRGITYGTREPDFSDEPEGDVGLLFMCYQQSIAHQFEFMQNSWADNERFLPPQQPGVDPVIGQGGSQDQNWPISHGSSTTASFNFGEFVTLKGGEYFFTPSISSLQKI